MAEATKAEWITVPRAAVLLGLKPHTVYDLINRGELVAEVVEATGHRRRRHIQVARAAVDDYVSQARVKPGSLRHLYQWT